MKDLRQSPRYASFMDKIGWKVISIDNTNKGSLFIYIRKLGPFGSIAKVQRAGFPLPWIRLTKILKNNWVWFCKYEPDVLSSHTNQPRLVPALKKNRFHQDSWPLLATKTIKLDLTPSLDIISSRFKKDARYCLRIAQNSGLKIEKNDFDLYYSLWQKSSRIKRLWIPKKTDFQRLIESFSTDCFCLTASKNTQTMSGLVVLTAKQTAYYYYSSNLPTGKDSNAPYLLVLEALKIAKGRGCRIFDFEGIYDHRWPNQAWQGFSHFKRSFGGEEISYVGSFIKWF